jgi:HK97 family phage prohead protease/HK97 family phage major capsid protein
MEEKNQEKKQENREELETRAHYAVSNNTLEVRSDSDEMVIEGYAALYDNETNIGPFRETIARGAFDDVLENDVRALMNHDPNYVLGRSGAGTLELEVDEKGLKYRVKLGEQQYAKDLYESVKRGDISQSSFAFTIAEQSWNEKRTVRSIDKVATLLDVSPVTYPAYPDTHGLQARNEELDSSVNEDVVEESTNDEIKEVRKTKTKKQSKMNLKELNELRGKFYNEHVTMIENAESEGRELTNEEETRADYLEGEVERLDNKIKRRKAHEDMIARSAHMGGSSVSEAKEIDKVNRNFSLSRAIQAASFGKSLEGAEAEWAQEAAKEYGSRGLQMSGQIGIPSSALYRAGGADDFQAGSGDGSGYVATNVPGLIEALRAPTMAERVGVTTINNATGNLKFPRVSAKAVGTAETEVSADADSTMELDELTLSPTRVANKTKFSKQLILQGGAGIDSMIASELAAGINETIDKDVFAKAVAGAGYQGNLTGGSITAAHIFAAEKAVLAAGGDLANGQFVLSPSAMSILKGEAAVASIRALVNDNKVDGFATHFTPNLVDSATDQGDFCFGDFAKGMVLAYFGGVDILVDPYSNAGTAQIALHVNKFYDADVRQAGALARIKNFVA